MARKTTTTYSCDACGKTVAKKAELHRFVIWDTDRRAQWTDSVATEVCDDCEPALIGSVGAFLPAEAREALETWRRLS